MGIASYTGKTFSFPFKTGKKEKKSGKKESIGPFSFLPLSTFSVQIHTLPSIQLHCRVDLNSPLHPILQHWTKLKVVTGPEDSKYIREYEEFSQKPWQDTCIGATWTHKAQILKYLDVCSHRYCKCTLPSTQALVFARIAIHSYNTRTQPHSLPQRKTCSSVHVDRFYVSEKMGTVW